MTRSDALAQSARILYAVREESRAGSWPRQNRHALRVELAVFLVPGRPPIYDAASRASRQPHRIHHALRDDFSAGSTPSAAICHSLPDELRAAPDPGNISTT